MRQMMEQFSREKTTMQEVAEGVRAREADHLRLINLQKEELLNLKNKIEEDLSKT